MRKRIVISIILFLIIVIYTSSIFAQSYESIKTSNLQFRFSIERLNNRRQLGKLSTSLKNLYDLFTKNKDFIEFASEGKFEDELSTYTKQWAVQRVRNNIKAKIIMKKGADAPVWKMNKIKFIEEEYQSPTATIIYQNKVAIFIHEEPVLIILIESEQLAQSYLNYFKILWWIAED